MRDSVQQQGREVPGLEELRHHSHNAHLAAAQVMQAGNRGSWREVVRCKLHKPDGLRMRAAEAGTWMPRASTRSHDEL